MTKILMLLIAACLICSITAQNENSCLSQCGSGCFVDSGSQRCRACPSGCVSCRDPDTCLACHTGYFLNEEKNCVSCNVTGCANCTTQGVCTACESNYFLANSTTCVYCGGMCEICASEEKCKKCRSDGYYGVYRSRRLGTCNYCPDGCKTCKSSGFCTSCKSGYTLSDFQCVTCSTIDPDCRTCDEEITQCYSCGQGRYLLNNTCLECSSGCETCSDDSRCEKCMEGYFLNRRHGCTPCMSNCKECKDSRTCTECYVGYGFDPEKGQCMPCNLDCGGINTVYIFNPETAALPSASLISPEVGGSVGYKRGAGGSGGAALTPGAPSKSDDKNVTDNEYEEGDDEDDDAATAGETNLIEPVGEKSDTSSTFKAAGTKSEEKSNLTKSETETEASKTEGETDDTDQTSDTTSNSTDAN